MYCFPSIDANWRAVRHINDLPNPVAGIISLPSGAYQFTRQVDIGVNSIQLGDVGGYHFLGSTPLSGIVQNNGIGPALDILSTSGPVLLDYTVLSNDGIQSCIRTAQTSQPGVLITNSQLLSVGVSDLLVKTGVGVLKVWDCFFRGASLGTAVNLGAGGTWIGRSTFASHLTAFRLTASGGLWQLNTNRIITTTSSISWEATGSSTLAVFDLSASNQAGNELIGVGTKVGAQFWWQNSRTNGIGIDLSAGLPAIANISNSSFGSAAPFTGFTSATAGFYIRGCFGANTKLTETGLTP